MKLDFLKERYHEYNVSVSAGEFGDGGEYAHITAPDSDEIIKVYYDPCDTYQPFMFLYAYQHVHCCDEEQVIECINQYITGESACIEFFCYAEENGETVEKPVFGGDISRELLDDLTVKKLRAQFYFVPKKTMYGCHFKVRSPIAKYNFDGRFETDEDGEPTIVLQNQTKRQEEQHEA